MLTYKNDPLLLDGETANDLIENEKSDTIFLDKNKGILNLYSAFVKKTDFIKKNKKVQPLQKTVYVKVPDKIISLIKGKYNKRDIKNILESYTCKRSHIKSIDRWWEKKIIPIILLRVIAENNKRLIKLFDEIEYITDFVNKSKFYPPKTLESLLIAKNVYLAGCSLGDGHIDKECKSWTLVDGTSYKEKMVYSELFVKNLTRLLKTLINKSKIVKYPTKFELRVNNKVFCRFLNFFFGLPTGKKKNHILKKPKIVNLVKKDLAKYFWRGCFDTDGSVAMNSSLDFCSSDSNLKQECILYLKKINIESKMSDTSVILNIPELKKFSYIGFSHPRKQKEFLSVLKKGAKYLTVNIKKDKNSINPSLLKIYKVLRVDKNYRVRVHYRNLTKNGITKDKIRKMIKELFGYDLKTTTGGLMYFKSKKVYNYLNNLFIFEPYWKPINNKEEIQLINEWNNV